MKNAFEMEMSLRAAIELQIYGYRYKRNQEYNKVSHYKPSRCEKKLMNYFTVNCSEGLIRYLFKNKILVAVQLGMDIEPYCLDGRYSIDIRYKVAKSQATMYLYNYFVKGNALQ